MRRTDVQVASEPRAPGAFMPDGSWNPDAGLHHRGYLHRLVATLVRDRRDGRLTPQRAAQTIRAADAAVTFPNAGQWAGSASWVLVQASTPAEEAVKREGRGIAGHWCGERWLDGYEHECPEPRHRPAARPEQVAETVGAIVASLAADGEVRTHA